MQQCMGLSRFQENFNRNGYKGRGKSINPSLWTKYSSSGIVLLGINFDDCLVIGSDSRVDEVLNGLKMQKFGLKVEGFLNTYLSCKVHVDRK